MSSVSMPLQYKRLFSGPLDTDSVFASLEEAQLYAQSATSYAGQIISVLDNGDWKAFMIDSNKKLHAINSINNDSNTCIWEELP